MPRFTLKGADKLANKLGNLSTEAEEAIQQELMLTGFYVEAEAKKRAPVRVKKGGRLRESIHTTQSSDKKTVTVGTNVEYSAYQEYGTVKNKAHPYLVPAYLLGVARFPKKAQARLKKLMGS